MSLKFSMQSEPAIAVSKPAISDAEIEAVTRVLCSGQLAQGSAVAAFEKEFAHYLGVDYAIATSSGTTALQLALLAHGIGSDDEVITTPFTFIATANAIRYVGAKPVFADIDPHTLNLSPESVESRLTDRTRAIIPVHLYGNPCDMKALTAIAARNGLALIEDACQAHGARFAGQCAGSFGTGCFSFYATKNMTCGEGGMISTSDPVVAERATLLRSHAMRIAYVHEQLGYNFRMTDIQAALGLAQLHRLDSLNAQRAANAAFYDSAFVGLDVRRPDILDEARCVWHQYTLLLDPACRDAIAGYLRERRIAVGVYYPMPVHRQPAYEAYAASDCPEADSAAARVLSLPVHPGVSERDRSRVVMEVLHGLAEA